MWTYSFWNIYFFLSLDQQKKKRKKIAYMYVYKHLW